MYSDYLDTISFVSKFDPDVADGMEQELKRQRRNLELIASENLVSPAVMAAMGSVLTNKYAEGYPGKRYYGGCQCVDIVEEIARKRACELFGADHANVQPHSGRRKRISESYRLCKIQRDRRCLRRTAHGRYGAHRRSRCGRRSSESRALCRYRYNDYSQDTQRPARRSYSLQRGICKGDR